MDLNTFPLTQKYTASTNNPNATDCLIMFKLGM